MKDCVGLWGEALKVLSVSRQVMRPQYKARQRLLQESSGVVRSVLSGAWKLPNLPLSAEGPLHRARKQERLSRRRKADDWLGDGNAHGGVRSVRNAEICRAASADIELTGPSDGLWKLSKILLRQSIADATRESSGCLSRQPFVSCE